MRRCHRKADHTLLRQCWCCTSKQLRAIAFGSDRNSSEGRIRPPVLQRIYPQHRVCEIDDAGTGDRAPWRGVTPLS